MDVMSFIKQMFLSDAGSFASVLGFLGLCTYLIIKITKIITQHDSLMKSLEKHDNFIDDIRKALSYIKGILELLQNKGNDFAQSHSPISLSDKGKELSDSLHVDAMVDSNWVNTKKQIDSAVTNKNAYDIQQYCIETMAVEPEKFLSNDDVLRLKQHAYNIGRTFQAVSIVPALAIRDRYFKECNVPVSDVDKFDPMKNVANNNEQSN